MEDFVPFTKNIQRLVIYAYHNNGITFDKQNIYNSKVRYYSALSRLKKNKLIIQVCFVCGIELKENEFRICKKRSRDHKNPNKLISSYDLTQRGRLFAKFLNSSKH